MNFFRITWQRLNSLLYYILCISLFLSASACTNSNHSPSDNGSISFSVEWRGAPIKQSTGAGFRELDCGATGVASIEAEIYDENNSYLTAGGPWLCSAHAGTIENVPEGTNRKVVVLGRDVNNNVIYRGEKSGITVTAGQTTNAGTIVVDHVNTAPIATITSPIDGSSYAEGDTITFSGTGSDAEDGTLTGSSLVWTSNIDGQIGTGTSFTSSSLSAGTRTHTITLTATDNDGASGNDSVVIVPGWISHAQGWISHANMPTGGYWGATAVWNNILYVIGGGDGRYSAIEAYDPISDSWVINNDYHVGHLVRAITVGNVIYVLGDDGEFWEYTPSNDTWETLPDAPTPKWVSELAEVEGKIYVFGGGVYINLDHNSVWEYNPSSGVWTSKAPMPTGRYGSATAVIDNKIYVFGGNYGTSSNEAYDPSTDSWEIKSDLPLRLSGWDVAGPSGWRIVVVEAKDPGSTVIYDPITDTYEWGDEIPTPRDGLPMGDSIIDSIFVAGGKAAPNELESYQPAEVSKTGLRKPKAAPSAAMMEAYMQKHKKMDGLMKAMEK